MAGSRKSAEQIRQEAEAFEKKYGREGVPDEPGIEPSTDLGDFMPLGGTVTKVGSGVTKAASSGPVRAFVKKMIAEGPPKVESALSRDASLALKQKALEDTVAKGRIGTAKDQWWDAAAKVWRQGPKPGAEDKFVPL